MRHSDWRTLLILAACVAFLFQGTRGLYESTEGRYAEVGREMTATGDWMVPRLDGHPHWTKPPLTYWCIAVGLETAGRNEWGARLFGAVALVGATAAVAALGTSMYGGVTGWLAALMFVTFPLAAAGANVVSPDMLLTCWEVIAVWCFWRSLRAASRAGARRWITAMWSAFGLAFLTKGPPGMLPLAAIVVFVVVTRRRGRATPPPVTLAGLALFVVIGLGWYLVMVARDPSLAGYFLGTEVWGRVATGMHHRNGRWYMPVIVFGPALLLGAGAWLAGAIVDVRRAARAGWRGFLRSAAGRDETLFLLLWFFVPLLVFTLAKSRLPLYVLPLMPAMALAFARLAIRSAGEEKARRRVIRVAVASAVVLVALKAAAARVHSPQDMRPLAERVLAAHPDRVAIIDTPALYGLQFYLDGKLERVTSAGLHDELDAMRGRLAGDPSRCEVLLTTRGTPPLLERRCNDGSLACTTETVSPGQVWTLRRSP